LKVVAKVCSRCGEAKPLGEFYRQEGGAKGRRGMCKECFKAAQRVAWVRNPRVQARRREIMERWRDEGFEP
jgi:hypothetical protein